jgi:hypothetical protein
MNKNNNALAFDDRNVYLWIEQESSIMLKAAVKECNDPVELTAEEAGNIAQSLLTLAEMLNRLNHSVNN